MLGICWYMLVSVAVGYRKPTATDTTIHFTSIHPNEHKLAAYRCYIERMLNLQLNAEPEKREWSTILHIAQKNGFPPTLIQKLRHQIKQKPKHTTPHANMNENKRWGNIHLHFPTNMQGHRHIQKHKR